LDPSQGQPLFVDAHNDLLIEVAFRMRRRGETNPFAEHWLPKLRSGGVSLQVCPVYVDLPLLPDGALREALSLVAAFHRAVHDNADDVLAVRTRDDLAAVERRERIGLLLSLEGAEPLGYDPWLAEVLWELGARMISLTWNRRNPFADGAGEVDAGGLSGLGRQLVDLCVELGFVLDLAHAGERTFREVLDRIGDAPVIVSHADCRAVFDHPRNLSDDALKELAEHAGVLCVMQHPISVDHTSPTIDRVVDHIDHAVEVMGIDHVGLGSDFTQQLARSYNWVAPPDALLPDGMAADAAIEGLAGPDDFPNLVAALRRRGYEGESLEAVLGGNLLRVLGDALPRA
jgi:membrane dipeptidase